jgi:hypothetical protein
MSRQKTTRHDSFAPLQGAKVAQLVTFRRWGRLWNLVYRLRGWQAIHYEVSPMDV